MSDYETICDITSITDEEAIDAMINISNIDAKSTILKSSFSSTQIADEVENVSTAKELNALLKNMNILLENGHLSPLLKNNNLVLFYNGIDKKGNKYTQLRWTIAGRKYILKALTAYTTIIEPLLITNTQIQECKHETYKGYYYLNVMDQYGRWWSWIGDSNSNEKSSNEYIRKIEIQELNKTIIDIDLYSILSDAEIGHIKRHEEILYVFSYDMYADSPTDKYAGYVLAITKDELLYAHNKVFDNYEDLKKLALKIKESGIVNLEFWKCLGLYTWNDENNEYEEFEEIYYYDDSEDRADQDVLDMIDADRLSDGIVPGFRD